MSRTDPPIGTLRLQLIGACALLGRISGSRLTDDENNSINRAINDLVALFPLTLEAWNTSGGGTALEVKR